MIPFADFWRFLTNHANCISGVIAHGTALVDNDAFNWQLNTSQPDEWAIELCWGKTLVAGHHFDPALAHAVLETARCTDLHTDEYEYVVVSEDRRHPSMYIIMRCSCHEYLNQRSVPTSAHH